MIRKSCLTAPRKEYIWPGDTYKHVASWSKGLLDQLNLNATATDSLGIVLYVRAWCKLNNLTQGDQP